MNINIKKADNGYVLKTMDVNEDGEYGEIYTSVFESNGDNQNHIISMLYTLLDELNEIKGKYENRIHIAYEEPEGDIVDINGMRHKWIGEDDDYQGN